MNVENIALVRATNIIPTDGVVRPVSEVPYLQKEKGTAFSFAVNDLLRRKGLFKEIDWTNPDEIATINNENNGILNQYMPYSSDYNSMVLWSLNGLVPDDMNNIFSNKPCAIIESLSEQIDQSQIVSLVPTDTAIKGSVSLSSKASILISKEKYDSLSPEEKTQIEELDINITIFEGDLKEAVDNELDKDGKYTAETLSLRREDEGYVQSDTSDEVRDTVDSIAAERNIPQVLHWNVITGQNDELDRLKSVENEFKNGVVVREFYKNVFFEYLFSKMDIDNSVKSDAMYYPESDQYMQSLCEEIDRIGIDKYKSIVEEYNKSLEKLRQRGELPTPQDIVDAHKEKAKIDLLFKVEEIMTEDAVLSSAINATEEVTRISTLDEQVYNIEQITKEKGEKNKGEEIK